MVWPHTWLVEDREDPNEVVAFKVAGLRSVTHKGVDSGELLIVNCCIVSVDSIKQPQTILEMLKTLLIIISGWSLR